MAITPARLLENALELSEAPESFRTTLDSLTDMKRVPRIQDQQITAWVEEAQHNPGALRLGRALFQWDYLESDSWTAGTTRNSEERRNLIYAQMGLGSRLAKACSARFAVTPIDRPTLIAEDHLLWYPHTEPKTFYWDGYARQLRAGGWKEPSINTLDESTTAVVSRLADPTAPKAYQSKGIVVGYVQSGKTANFTGVIAKAADAGYRLFIVLAGLINVLRDQTQRRLDKELVGKELLEADPDGNEYASDHEWERFLSHGGLPRDLGSFDWIRLTGPGRDYVALGKGLKALEFDRLHRNRPAFDPANLARAEARLLVLKKNGAVLGKVIRDLERLHSAPLDQIPALIIDDESDQASQNTRRPTTAEVKERTKINQAITRLLEILPRAQYVGYTATPSASVFADLMDRKDLFPKDFILSLPRPVDYMGVADFVDVSDEQPEGYDSNERAFVRDVRGDDAKRENLPSAIDCFVLSGAIKLFRESVESAHFRHHTMLVHSSAFRVVHKEDADSVDEIVQNAGYWNRSAYSRLEALWKADFVPISRARSGSQPASFTELRPFVDQCLTKLKGEEKLVRVVNGDNKDDTPNFDSEPIWSILVGGTKLSRGYTIEGLTISYYRRATDTADTLMQMGRWFGFRRGYRDLVRLYIGRAEVVGKASKKNPAPTLDLYEAFKAASLDEEEFRRELIRYASLTEPRITPRDVQPLVSAHQLAPTSRNKMHYTRLVVQNFGGEWCEKTWATAKKPEIEKNAERMQQLLRGSSIRELRLSAAIDRTNKVRKEIEFGAVVSVLTPKAVSSFLEQYVWPPRNRGILIPYLEFLDGRAGSPNITQWLMLAPQLSNPADAGWPGAKGQTFSVKERGRLGDTERFKAYSEPDHRAMAEFLVGLTPGKALDRSTQSLRRDDQAVLLFYPVRDPDRDDQALPPTMGFALLFPSNSIVDQSKFVVAPAKIKGK